MKTALWPLQKAIFERLENDTNVMASVSGIFDDVPENAALPYIVLGDDTAGDYSSKTFDGEDITHTLHVFSQAKGKKEAKQIMDLALQSITASPLTVTGFSVDFTMREFIEVLVEDSGLYHGVMRLRFVITQ